MTTTTVVLLATLIAISQAAPQLQQQAGESQQTAAGSSPDASSHGVPTSGGSSSAAGSNTSGAAGTAPSSGSQPVTVVFPSINNLLSSFNMTGGSSAENPIAAIISIIPNAINRERDRFSSAVEQLVSKNVDAFTGSIGAAAQTGGTLLSNGVRVVGSWPTFWANVFG